MGVKRTPIFWTEGYDDTSDFVTCPRKYDWRCTIWSLPTEEFNRYMLVLVFQISNEKDTFHLKFNINFYSLLLNWKAHVNALMVAAMIYVFRNKKIIGANVTWVCNYKMIHERVKAVSLSYILKNKTKSEVWCKHSNNSVGHWNIKNKLTDIL